MDKWEVIIILRDAKGRTINKGDVIKHGQSRGVVKNDEFEGLYAELENGYKLRVQNVHKRMYVIYKVRKKHHNVGKRM